VQRLRNPARKNFFSPGDLARAAGRYFSGVKTFEYITRESVWNWISNGAITAAAKARIMRAYRDAPDAFKKTHKLSFVNGDVLDSMRMEIVAATPSCFAAGFTGLQLISYNSYRFTMY